MTTKADRHLSVEFDAEVSERGELLLPRDLEATLHEHKGKRIRVRVTSQHLSEALRRRAVTEEEVARICETQFESRENVLRFLLAQGSLADRQSFRKRAKEVVA
jgi:hypothetical protein